MVDQKNQVLEADSGADMAVNNESPVVIKERDNSVRSNRDALPWEELENRFGRSPLSHQDSTIVRVKDTAGSFCMQSPIVTWIVSLFACIDWIRKYSIKTDLIPDIICGLTVSVIHIPQGMAYGLLAGSGPASGLYVSFFPVLIYCIMSNSRHVSLGTMAITSIMVSNVLSHTGAIPSDAVANLTRSDVQINWPPTVDEVISSLSMISGLLMICCGILRLGVLSQILSDQMVTAFTCGAVVHIATAQFDSILGTVSPKRSGALKLIYGWIDIASNIPNVNFACLAISFIVIIVLLIFKELFDPWLKKRFNVPMALPIELIVLILSTLVSWALNFKEKYNVPVIGDIPSGLPELTPPRFDLAFEILPDAIAITLVSYTITLSVGILYSKKYKYVVDPSQELVAMGSANIFGSLFGCFPATGGLSRSTLLEKSEVKSPLASMISCAILLIVILYIGHLFYHLPKCVLGCVILVCLKNMFIQSANIRKVWKISGLEGISWIITFGSVIAIDVDYGIIFGVASSFLILIVQFILPNASLMGLLPSTEIYVDVKQFHKARQIPGLKIFRYSSALFFLNRNNFRDALYKLTLDSTYPALMKKLGKGKPLDKPVSAIIIDCSAISFIDSSGIEILVDVINTLKEFGVSCYLASCTASLMAMCERMQLRNNLPKDYSSIFPTVHDAVIYYFKNFRPSSVHAHIVNSPVRF